MKKISRWLPAILLISVIFIFSSIPSKEMPSLGAWDTLVKKGGHMLGYGMLAVAFWYGLKWVGKHAWTAFGLSILHGLFDEFHQSFTPGRNPSLVDALVFDAAGAALLLVLMYWGRRKFIKQPKTDGCDGN